MVALVVGVYYLYWTLENDSVGQDAGAQLTYSQSDLGLEFNYLGGSDGYVVGEKTLTSSDLGPIKALVLRLTEDTLHEPPVGGEGAPVILVSVFENTKKQFPRAWADENIQYSNINLIMGEVEETVVGGANAIRYMADGLYASENVVVAHGDHVYVITGQFMDQDSPIRHDYQTLVESIRFIPTPEQN